MQEKRMLELADQLKSLRELRAELQADVKEVTAKIDAVEASLIEIMTAEECTGFKRGNNTFSLVVKEYPGAVPECKEELYDARSRAASSVHTVLRCRSARKNCMHR